MVLFGGLFVITTPQDLRSIYKSDRRQCGVKLAKLLAEGEQSALPEASHSSEKQEEIMMNASSVAISWLFHKQADTGLAPLPEILMPFWL